MSRKRRYQLLCRIARALDVVGDRWALLILRDLHAGPARFRELEHGLGIATNLLTTRLAELSANGLVTKQSVEGQDHYVLTETGEATDRILWELARFGLRLDPDDDIRPPGNLRTLVLPLRFTLSAVRKRPILTTRLVVDGEVFTVRTSPRRASVDYGDSLAGEQPDVEVKTDYEALLAVGEGRLEADAFLRDHIRVDGDAAAGAAFLEMFAAAFETYDD